MSRQERMNLNGRLRFAASLVRYDRELYAKLLHTASVIRTGCCLPGVFEHAVEEGRELLSLYFSC